MSVFWSTLGFLMILMGIFNRRLLRKLGLQPLSEVFTTPRLQRSSRRIEQIVRWLVIVLGLTFLVHGLHGLLPDALSDVLTASLAGLSVLLLLAMFGIAIANWKTR